MEKSSKIYLILIIVLLLFIPISLVGCDLNGINNNQNEHFKSDTTLTLLNDLSKEFDGQPVAEPIYTSSSDAEIVVQYKIKSASDNTYTTTKPTDVGEYNIKISVNENETYNAVSIISDFSITSSHLVFTYNDGMASVKQNADNKPAGSLIIPATANGYTVNKLDAQAFYNCKTITSILIPNSINVIENNAFSGCDNLTDVKISSISDWCNISFSSSKSNPLSVANNLYLNDTKITALTIPNGTTRVKEYAFYNYNALQSVTISESVTSIDEGAFSGCSGLKTIVLPEGVETIGNSSFSNCNSLETITIPKSLRSIGFYSFGGCDQLSRVNISSISDWLKITFESNPLSIAKYLYLNGEEVINLEIPSGVTEIKAKAFSGCKSIKNITIPSSLKRIGTDAFNGCYIRRVNVSSISDFLSIDFQDTLLDKWSTTYPDANYPHLYINDEEITDIIIPNGITEINCAFYGYKGLKSVIISDGVVSIASNAFHFCKNLKSVVISETVRVIGSSAFSACDNLEKVYYKGTVTDWANISIQDYNTIISAYAKRYYYSENQPTNNGNYWHYVNGVPTIYDYIYLFLSSYTALNVKANITGQYTYTNSSAASPYTTTVTMNDGATPTPNATLSFAGTEAQNGVANVKSFASVTVTPDVINDSLSSPGEAWVEFVYTFENAGVQGGAGDNPMKVVLASNPFTSATNLTITYQVKVDDGSYTTWAYSEGAELFSGHIARGSTGYLKVKIQATDVTQNANFTGSFAFNLTAVKAS